MSGLGTEQRITKYAAPVIGGNDDTNQRRVAFHSRVVSGRENPEMAGNDVVVHGQPINIRISMIISPCRHADEQCILGATVLMRVIDTGWNHHQIAIKGCSEYFVNQTVCG